MKRESLDGLKAAFEQWRSKKRYRQEAVPADLLARARRAAQHHGPTAIARATRVDRNRLKSDICSRRTRQLPATRTPAFSRLELAAPVVAARPFAELEMTNGLKVRLFAQNVEVLGMLSSLLDSRGAQ